MHRRRGRDDLMAVGWAQMRYREFSTDGRMLEGARVGYGSQGAGCLHEDARAAAVPQTHGLGVAVERCGDDTAGGRDLTYLDAEFVVKGADELGQPLGKRMFRDGIAHR